MIKEVITCGQPGLRRTEVANCMVRLLFLISLSLIMMATVEVIRGRSFFNGVAQLILLVFTRE